jgi:hypothetical protein
MAQHRRNDPTFAVARELYANIAELKTAYIVPNHPK